MNLRILALVVSLAPNPAGATPRVTLDLAEQMRPGQTVVWTAGMQSAIDRTIGSQSALKLVGVTPDNPLIGRLAAFDWREESVMPEGGWMVEAGRPTPELAERATRRWRELAGEGAAGFELPDVPISEQQRRRAIVAFAGIFRRLEFVQAFATSRTLPLQFQAGSGKPSPVRFFGVKGRASGRFADTVRVLGCRPSAGEFALQLRTRVADEAVILYRPGGEALSVGEAVAWVREWRGKWNPIDADEGAADDRRLHRGDDLRVPELALSLRTDLRPELAGLLQIEGEEEPWVIGAAVTEAKLEMDARGVRFESKSTLEVDPFGALPPPPVPRRFWCDRPFFLFLWRDGGGWPYAAAWIGSGDGLAKFGGGPGG